MIPRNLSFLFNETPSNARYRRLKLLCQSSGFFFARNRSLITTRNLWIGRNSVVYNEPIHNNSVLQNLRNLTLSRFNIPKYSFQTIRWHTSFNDPKPAVSYSIRFIYQLFSLSKINVYISLYHNCNFFY